MLISELVAKLEEIKAKCGDKEVLLCENSTEWCFSDIYLGVQTLKKRPDFNIWVPECEKWLGSYQTIMDRQPFESKIVIARKNLWE